MPLVYYLFSSEPSLSSHPEVKHYNIILCFDNTCMHTSLLIPLHLQVTSSSDSTAHWITAQWWLTFGLWPLKAKSVCLGPLLQAYAVKEFNISDHLRFKDSYVTLKKCEKEIYILFHIPTSLSCIIFQDLLGHIPTQQDMPAILWGMQQVRTTTWMLLFQETITSCY